jgi:hypothetical protein
VEAQGPSAPGALDARIPFEVAFAGSLDIVIDWSQVTNRVTTIVCRGAMTAGLGCSSVLIDGNRNAGKKPTIAAAPAQPGLHTLWITNGGPGREQVRYEVGLLR